MTARIALGVVEPRDGEFILGTGRLGAGWRPDRLGGRGYFLVLVPGDPASATAAEKPQEPPPATETAGNGHSMPQRLDPDMALLAALREAPRRDDGTGAGGQDRALPVVDVLPSPHIREDGPGGARRSRPMGRRPGAQAVSVRTRALAASERRQRARIAAFALHSQGKTNTRAATAAFLKRFEDQVDPERKLSEAERQRRALAARRAYMAKLALHSMRKRRR